MALTTIKTTSLPDDAITSAKIADESVDEARVQISNAGTNGQYLQKQSGNTGGLTWADGVGGSTGVNFLDSVIATWGTGNDLRLYHDGSDSYIADEGTGDIIISSGTITFKNQARNETHANFIGDGGCELYHNNVKKFETRSGGADVHGTLGVKGIEGGAATINLWADEGDDAADKWRLLASESANTFTISAIPDGGSWETSIECNGDGNVELYYDNVKKFETTSAGVKISGSGSDAVELEGDVWFNNNEHAGADIYFNSGDKHLLFEDSVIAKFGGGGDLQIYHDGSHSHISDAGTGDLKITANDLRLNGNNGSIKNYGESETFLTWTNNGAVELYYDNVKKFETASGGVTVTGMVLADQLAVLDGEKATFGDSNDLQIWHNNWNSFVQHTGTSLGNLYIDSIDADVVLRSGDGSGSVHTAVNCVENGSVELYYDNVKKFHTTTSGSQLSGHLFMDDDNKVQLGTSQDLQLYHDGTHSRIVDSRDAGTMRLQADGFKLIDKDAGETMISAAVDGDVELYYDNSKKLETTSGGVTVTGSVTTNDINLSNLTAPIPNEVDGTRGNWTMQEGADDLFLINRVNGKKYKFNLTEVG